MFHHDDGVPYIPEFLENLYQAVGVATVKADAGLVEDVERPDEGASERRGQIDALAFSTTQRGTLPVQSQVAQPDIGQKLKPAVDFRQESLGYFSVARLQAQVPEPLS